MERLRYYMKEKDIRLDIIEASINTYGIDNLNKIYNKSLTLNKLIKKEIGQAVISSYKRAYSILESELKNKESELSSNADPNLFKSEHEKNIRSFKIIVDRFDSTCIK